MKQFLLKSFLIGIVLVVSACGTNESGDTAEGEAATGECGDPLIPIEVSFTWEPTSVQAEEELTFTAAVTHDGQPITEADDVQFEIWEHNNPDYHHMVDTNNEGNGEYTLDWTFDEDGVYYAYYHVTACDMHRMEKDMLEVGDVNVDEILAEPDTVVPMMDHGEGDHGESHNH